MNSSGSLTFSSGGSRDHSALSGLMQSGSVSVNAGGEIPSAGTNGSKDSMNDEGHGGIANISEEMINFTSPRVPNRKRKAWEDMPNSDGKGASRDTLLSHDSSSISKANSTGPGQHHELSVNTELASIAVMIMIMTRKYLRSQVRMIKRTATAA